MSEHDHDRRQGELQPADAEPAVSARGETNARTIDAREEGAPSTSDRTSFVEDLSPQGPIVALDVALEVVRNETAALSRAIGAVNFPRALIAGAVLRRALAYAARLAAATGLPANAEAMRRLDEVRAVAEPMLKLAPAPLDATDRQTASGAQPVHGGWLTVARRWKAARGGGVDVAHLDSQLAATNDPDPPPTAAHRVPDHTEVGTSPLINGAHGTRTPAAGCPMLPVALLQRFIVEAGTQLRELREHESEHPTVATGLANQLAPEQATAEVAAAALHGQVLTQGTPDAELLEAAGLDAGMVIFRARLGNLQHTLSSLRAWVEAAPPGVIASITAVFSRAEALLTSHVESALGALQYVQAGLARHSRAAIDAKWDALPPSDAREFLRQFALRASRRAALEAAQEGFAGVVRRHHLDGDLFHRPGETIGDARLRALLAKVAAIVAVTSGRDDGITGNAVAGTAAGTRAATPPGTGRPRRLSGDGG